MCGIAGIYGLEQVSNPEQRMRSMLDRMSHRGPDAEGVYRDDNVILGHKRLSIIDLSSAGHQPMTNGSTTLS